MGNVLMTKLYTLSLEDAKERISSKEVTVGIVGFGYIGTCIGAVLAEKGLQVLGVDINPAIIKEINEGKTSINEPGLSETIAQAHENGKLKATTNFSELQQVDIIIITVGTPLDENHEADMKYITEASRTLSPFLAEGQIVILKSTIPPGTTQDKVKPLLESSGLEAGKDFGLVFSPERLAEGKALPEFTTIPIVIGGITQKCADLCSCFWKEILGVETVIVPDPKAAEMTKLADNLWIDVNIALGNEIALLCDKLGIDALEVINAANTLPKVNYNVNILMPSMGVGGYCLTKDPWFVHSMGKQHGVNLHLPSTSRKVNDSMPVHTFELIKTTLQEQKKDLKSSKICILGVSFKSNTGDCRFTPTKHTISLLEKAGCTLSIHDPWVNEEDAKSVTSIPLENSIEQAIKGADCIAFFTGHPEFKTFSLEKLKQLSNDNAVFIDGRNIFNRNEMEQIKKLGFVYRGVGRK